MKQIQYINLMNTSNYIDCVKYSTFSCTSSITISEHYIRMLCSSLFYHHHPKSFTVLWEGYKEETSESCDPVCSCLDLQRYMGTYIEYPGTGCPCDFIPGASSQTPVHVASQNLQNKIQWIFFLAFFKGITF